jgi:hypothetical protein
MAMSSAENGGGQREKQCAVCGNATKYPLELNERFYCSSACLSKYREEVGHHQFHRDTKATFEQKRQREGIPERALLYNSMCRRCHKKMAEKCKTNQYINGLHREELRKSETAPWCCHARFNLSSSLSDGSVPLEAARKIQAMAEEIVRDRETCERVVGPEALRGKMAKSGGLHGVTTTILDIAAAELAINPDYRPREDHTPPVADGEFMVHYAACLECDPAFASECHEQAEQKEVNRCLDEVQELISERWCEHTLNALSALRLNRNMSTEKLQTIVSSAERLKDEHEDFGVTTRHLFITLGRAVQA